MSLRTIERRLVGDDGARLGAFEQSLPSVGRAIVEIVYVLGVLLAPELATSPRLTWTLGVTLSALGVLVLRPWRTQSPNRSARIALSVAAVALVGMSLSARPRDAFEKPRIGIVLEIAGYEAGDPGTTSGSGCVRITSVRPGSAAAGRLRAGDRIVAIDGTALDRTDPAGDVVRRSHDPTRLGPVAVVSILREHHALDVRLELGPGPVRGSGGSGRDFFLQLCVRDLCLLGLAVLIVLSDGQQLSQIGLVRQGGLRELAHAGPVLLGTYLVHLAAALPLAALAKIGGFLQSDVGERTRFVGALVGNALEVHAWEIPIYLGLAGAFEEVVFRGFLITRLRRVLGGWTAALGVAAVLFGLGHLTEGVLGALQTTALGIWFGWVFLRRERLASVIVAHAAFNTIMFALMIYFVNTGFWDRAQRLIGH